MFKPGDFDLTLEAELKLRVVTDEIDECTDIKALQENLKASSTLLMHYQQIINRMILDQINKDLEDFGLLIKNIEDS
jgi:hypothetical protein